MPQLKYEGNQLKENPPLTKKTPVSATARTWRKPPHRKPKPAPLLQHKENSLHKEIQPALMPEYGKKLHRSCCMDTHPHTQFLSCLGKTQNYITVPLFGYEVKANYSCRIIYIAMLCSTKTHFLIITLLMG